MGIRRQAGESWEVAGRGVLRYGVTGGVLLLVAAMVLPYLLVPLHREQTGAVDALVVLGSPTEADGYPGAEQRARVDEAVREYRRGRAPVILMSGGAVANAFPEAVGMAEYAQAQGVPPGAILLDPTSRNTVENLKNSERLLMRFRWRRVEVISSEPHLHRAALLLSHSSLQWRTHAAPRRDQGWQSNIQEGTEEVIGTAALRWFGLRAAPVLHRAKVMEGRVQGNSWLLADLMLALQDGIGMNVERH